MLWLIAVVLLAVGAFLIAYGLAKDAWKPAWSGVALVVVSIALQMARLFV